MEIDDGRPRLPCVAWRQIVKVKAAEGRPDLVDAGDDLIRIGTKLTSDLERFDALLLRHRKMLEHPTAGGSDILTPQSERLTLQAGNLVTSIQEPLNKPPHLYRATKPMARAHIRPHI